MASFQCKIGSIDGSINKFFLDGRNAEDIKNRLQKQGYYVLDITAVHELSSGKFNFFSKQSLLTQKELLFFTRQLSALLKSGMTLLESIKILSGKSSVSSKKLFNSIIIDLSAGISFSNSLSKYPETFSNVYVQSIYAGEKSGSFSEVLDRLVDHFERSQRLRASIIQSMIYPGILFLIASVIFSYLILSVVPKFSDIFKDMGRELPFYTALLLNTSVFLKTRITLIILIFFAILFEIKEWISSEKGMNFIDRKLLSFPITGTIIREYNIILICRTMSTLLSGGVPLAEALKIVKVAINNQILYDQFSRILPYVESGGSFSEGVRNLGQFPEMAIKMIKVGEETGRLSDMLLNIAEYYDTEVSEKVMRITAFLEPLLLLSTAVLTGGVVISLFLPVIQMSMSVKF